MMELTTYTELEIAHRLMTSYAQKCRHLHGHRYEVEITVASPSGLNKDGMIVDFKKLKEVVKEVLDDKWDHGACFNKADRIAEFMLNVAERKRLHIIDANPTLEWMVGNWVEDLNAAFRAKSIDLVVTKLKASETSKNTVTWTLDEKGRMFAGLPSQHVDDKAQPPAPKNDCASPGSTAKVDTHMPADGFEEDGSHPDDAPYLVAYSDSLRMQSAVVYSSLTGKELVEYCQGAVTKVGDLCGPAVVLGISRLPG